MECIHRQRPKAKGWELFPKHILDLICEKLESTKNALHFGAVCPEWYSILKHGRSKLVHQRQIPMLLYPGKSGTTIYNITTNKFSDSKLSVPRDKRYIGSSNGWILAVDEYMNVTLYKPFSMLKGDYIDPKYTIHLPRLLCAYEGKDIDKPVGDWRFDFLVRNVLITSDPIENSDECIIFLAVDAAEIAYHRLNKDKSWKQIEFSSDMDNFFPHDFILHKNRLVAISYHGMLLSIDLHDFSLSQELEVREIRDVVSGFFARNFVESSYGSLWSIERVFKNTVDGNGHSLVVTKSFKILELDLDKRRWIEIKSIGHCALFFGKSSCICANAFDIPGCRPNCIYFTHDHHSLGRPNHDIGIYEIESGDIDFRFTKDALILSRMAKRQPLWVIPALYIDELRDRSFLYDNLENTNVVCSGNGIDFDSTWC